MEKRDSYILGLGIISLTIIGSIFSLDPALVVAGIWFLVIFFVCYTGGSAYLDDENQRTIVAIGAGGLVSVMILAEADIVRQQVADFLFILSIFIPIFLVIMTIFLIAYMYYKYRQKQKIKQYNYPKRQNNIPQRHHKPLLQSPPIRRKPQIQSPPPIINPPHIKPINPKLPHQIIIQKTPIIQTPSQKFELNANTIHGHTQSPSEKSEIDAKTVFSSPSISIKAPLNITPSIVPSNNLLNNRFQIIRLLISTNLSQIFIGQDLLDNNKIVVIKRFKKTAFPLDNHGQSRVEEFWKSEWQLTQAQSQGENQTQSIKTVHLIDAFCFKENGTSEYYIILDYIQGPSLLDWFKNNTSSLQNYSSAVIKSLIYYILLPMVSHMAFVHRLGIVHRDLTVRNVLILVENQIPQPIIIDWGMAKQVGVPQIFQSNTTQIQNSTGLNTCIQNMGTPPEIKMGCNPIACSDIFMFGHICYFLLNFGQEAGIPMSVSDTTLDLKKQNPRIPNGLCELIKRMTAYEPKDRIQTFEEIQKTLISIFNSLI